MRGSGGLEGKGFVGLGFFYIYLVYMFNYFYSSPMLLKLKFNGFFFPFALPLWCTDLSKSENQIPTMYVCKPNDIPANGIVRKQSNG